MIFEPTIICTVGLGSRDHECDHYLRDSVVRQISSAYYADESTLVIHRSIVVGLALSNASIPEQTVELPSWLQSRVNILDLGSSISQDHISELRLEKVHLYVILDEPRRGSHQM